MFLNFTDGILIPRNVQAFIIVRRKCKHLILKIPEGLPNFTRDLIHNEKRFLTFTSNENPSKSFSPNPPTTTACVNKNDSSPAPLFRPGAIFDKKKKARS